MHTAVLVAGCVHSSVFGLTAKFARNDEVSRKFGLTAKLMEFSD